MNKYYEFLGHWFTSVFIASLLLMTLTWLFEYSVVSFVTIIVMSALLNLKKLK